MKVLITGSSGWLGRHLVIHLSKIGHTPIGLDIVASRWTDVVGSITDKHFVQSLFAKHNFDGIIHTAALHKPDIAHFPTRSFFEVNVSGTLNLLEEARKRTDTRFVFTSTTSLMISQEVSNGLLEEAVWLDEDTDPLKPRNVYGDTKLEAEGLCRQFHTNYGLDVIILRTSRFFKGADNALTCLSSANIKSNELLYRRASVHDIAHAHVAALEQVHDLNFGLYVVSAPTPFSKHQLGRLKQDAASVVQELYPDAESAYKKAGWQLPKTIGRVYDGRRIIRDMVFEYETQFEDVIDALLAGKDVPI